MAPTDVDGRAVGLGVLLAAAVAFVHVSTTTSPITVSTTRTLVIAIGIAAVPAGVVVGLRSDNYNRHLIEGGAAAVCGTAAGILGWAVLRAAIIDGLPIAHRLDVVFVVVATNGPVFAMTAPLLFLVGGYTAARTAEFHSRSIDDELTGGMFQ